MKFIAFHDAKESVVNIEEINSFTKENTRVTTYNLDGQPEETCLEYCIYINMKNKTTFTIYYDNEEHRNTDYDMLKIEILGY